MGTAWIFLDDLFGGFNPTHSLFHMLFLYSLTVTFLKIFSINLSLHIPEKPSGHPQAWRFDFELKLLENEVMLNSVPYPQCLIYGQCKICVGLTTQVRCVEGPCSEFPRPVSPEEDDHDDEVV